MITEATSQLDQVDVQERIVGDVAWLAIRARGAEWSWLTPDEARTLARKWTERYTDD
jgi:hypothetical protein